jgi:hypothetical protein
VTQLDLYGNTNNYSLIIVIFIVLKIVYCDRIYIFGKASKIKKRLAELANRYNTIKELLIDIAPI